MNISCQWLNALAVQYGVEQVIVVIVEQKALTQSSG